MVNEIMTGRLHKREHDEWVVTYTEVNETINLQLHPDDVNNLIELDRIFDNLEARIASQPNVEFEIVNHQKLTGSIKYAKLKYNDKAN